MTKSIKEILIEKALLVTALFCAVTIIIILLFIFLEGLPAIQEYDFLTFCLKAYGIPVTASLECFR